MNYLGDLVLIKEEDVQIKEEELEINHDSLFVDDIGQGLGRGEKRALSPSSEVLQDSNKQLCAEQKVKVENQRSKNYHHSNKSLAGCADLLQQSQICESSLDEQSKYIWRNTQKLSVQARKMVMKVHEYFRNRNQLLSETDLQMKVAAATGISARTVQRVRKEFKEGWIESPPPKTRWAPILGNLDDFTEGCIRREILSFYEREEIPTLSALLEIIKEPPINFLGGKGTLRNLLKKIGFKYIKMEGGRRILIERDDIVAARCKYLRILGNNSSASIPRSEVYVGETIVSQRELMDNAARIKPRTERAQYIAVHAGGKNGFIPESLSLFRQKPGNNGGYHNTLSPECFQNWFEKQLLPNIPNNSLIIVNSLPCNSKLGVRVPDRSLKKSDIIHWLIENNIAHDASTSKSELLLLAKSNKEHYTYQIDEIAQAKGHEVLRLPPYHNYLNPMDPIWHDIKLHMKKELLPSDKASQDIKSIATDAVEKITAKDWQVYLKAITEIEEQYRSKDAAVDRLLETLAINLEETSTDEDD